MQTKHKQNLKSLRKLGANVSNTLKREVMVLHKDKNRKWAKNMKRYFAKYRDKNGARKAKLIPPPLWETLCRCLSILIQKYQIFTKVENF